MSHDPTPALAPHAPPPPAAILQLITNMWASQAAATFAALRGPDQLAAGARTAGELASALGTHAGATYRLLRGLAAAGIVRRAGLGGWELTEVGHCLRSDVPGSMRALLVAEMAPGHWLPWGQMVHAVRTGQPSTVPALGMDCWTYYDRTPEEARAFAEGMTGLSGLATQAVVGVYDAGWAREIVDLGGSQGAFLQALLEKNVAAHGVLFDRPAVIEGARAAWTGSALGARVAFQAGDFFDAVPAGGDLYLLKHILHDWNDDECARILRNVRRAMKPGGRVVAVEMIIDEAGPPSPAPLLDLNMLVMLTGRERTADEFRTLFSRAELQLTRLLPTPSPFVVIEAEAPH